MCLWLILVYSFLTWLLNIGIMLIIKIIIEVSHFIVESVQYGITIFHRKHLLKQLIYDIYILLSIQQLFDIYILLSIKQLYKFSPCNKEVKAFKFM